MYCLGDLCSGPFLNELVVEAPIQVGLEKKMNQDLLITKETRDDHVHQFLIVNFVSLWNEVIC